MQIFKFFVYFWHLIALQNAARSYYKFEWRSISCNWNVKYVKNTNCFVVKPEQKSIHYDVTYARELAKDVMGKITVKMPRPPKGELVTFFESVFDFCKLLEGTSNSKMMEAIQEGIATSTNFPKRCPLRMDVNYYINNFSINVARVPKFVPEVSFIAELDFYVLIPSEHIISLQISGSLEETVRSSLKKVQRPH